MFFGRGERIRTSDPSVPNRVLYQAEPRPDKSVKEDRNTARSRFKGFKEFSVRVQGSRFEVLELLEARFSARAGSGTQNLEPNPEPEPGTP